MTGPVIVNPDPNLDVFERFRSSIPDHLNLVLINVLLAAPVDQLISPLHCRLDTEQTVDHLQVLLLYLKLLFLPERGMAAGTLLGLI